MTQNDIEATEKALLLITLGFLEALNAGSIHRDEAFHTIGLPALVERMTARGVSKAVADLVGGLDEFEAIGELLGEAALRQAIKETIESCQAELRARPLREDRANVCLRLLDAATAQSS